MFRYPCVPFILASACAFGAMLPTITRAQAANTLEIVINTGPHAGTYKLPTTNTICLHVKARQQFSAAYKDISARDPKTLSGAGINVFDPDAPGPKRGEINIRFGDPDDKHPAAYEALIPRDSPGTLTFTKKGTLAELTFEGQVKDGTKLRMTATCRQVDEF